MHRLFVAIRPPEHIRLKLDIGYAVVGQTVDRGEAIIRPASDSAGSG